jgi:PAS domain S-box-containing protein
VTPALDDGITDIVFELSPEGIVLGFHGPEDTTWSTPNELIGRNVRDLLPPEAAEPVLNGIARAREQNGVASVEYRRPHADGIRLREVRMVRAERGVMMFLRDVTDRAVAKQRLEESETRFALMANGAPVLLWMAGTDGRCTFFNEVWLRFTGRALEQELGEGWAEGVHAEDFQRCMATYLDAFVARHPFSMVYRLRRADGVFRWILDQGAPRFLPNGEFAGYIGSCVDITEQKEAQTALQQMNQELERRVASRTSELEDRLRERDVLLREVHHRVKNNLQIVSSMIGLQSRTLQDEVARAIFDDCQTRIHSIALVHEGLYQSNDFSNVAFSPYATRLIDHIVRSTNVSSERITVDTQVETIAMTIDKAIPCGLILNELVTNAMKHAFPGDRRGRLRIELCAAGERELALVVSDDGVGLPAALDLKRTTSLGMRLVQTLVSQLGGTVAIDRANGTTFRIAFVR